MTALIFDTETTGLLKHPEAPDSLQPRIIEWGGVLVGGDGEILAELDVLINPEQVLEPVITKITGITDSDLCGQPTFSKRTELLRPLFEKADILISHNLPFDSTLMELELARAGITDWPWPERKICTVQEHAEAWGYRPKLLELYEHYTGQPLVQKHRALDDVLALLTICRKAGILK